MFNRFLIELRIPRIAFFLFSILMILSGCGGRLGYSAGDAKEDIKESVVSDQYRTDVREARRKNELVGTWELPSSAYLSLFSSGSFSMLCSFYSASGIFSGRSFKCNRRGTWERLENDIVKLTFKEDSCHRLVNPRNLSKDMEIDLREGLKHSPPN